MTVIALCENRTVVFCIFFTNPFSHLLCQNENICFFKVTLMNTTIKIWVQPYIWSDIWSYNQTKFDAQVKLIHINFLFWIKFRQLYQIQIWFFHFGTHPHGHKCKKTQHVYNLLWLKLSPQSYLAGGRATQQEDKQEVEKCGDVHIFLAEVEVH